MTNSADPDQFTGSTLFAKTGHVMFSKRRVKLYWIGHLERKDGEI